MSHVYTPAGSGAYVGAYTMPDDGDPRNASAFNVPMEGMAEDLKRVKAALDAGEVSYSAVRTFEFLLSNDTTYWSRVIDPFLPPTNARYWSQQAHASVRAIEAPLDLPDGFIISSVTVWLDPLTGRAGLPGTMPQIELLRNSVTLGPLFSGSSLGIQNDTSATLGAYEQLHSIELTLGSPHTVTRASSTYGLAFRNESGANAQNFTQLYVAIVSGTVKKVY